ncbi:MAG: hypothetical protein R3275_12275 [Saprospiraceae bacterium]|nr:hypothetical protein [Saprospiraceae bacterium]
MQKQWSFYDAFGRLYVIGFYHSHDTGNFVLYINNNISIIDFEIKDSKAYSFIIGNRLLQFRIDKASSGYNYDLKDHTPSIEAKPWEKFRDKVIAAMMISVVICVIAWLFLYAIGMSPW